MYNQRNNRAKAVDKQVYYAAVRDQNYKDVPPISKGTAEAMVQRFRIECFIKIYALSNASRLHHDEIMRRVDEITSQRQMREDRLAAEREVKMCPVSESVVIKKRRESLSEIFDMLLWSVEYTKTKDGLAAPPTDLKSESGRYSAEHVLENSDPEIKERLQDSEDGQDNFDDAAEGRRPKSVRFRSLSGKLRDRNSVGQGVGNDCLDTNLANALLLQPPNLANALEQILATLRPSIICKEDFISAVESFLKTGHFPPLNSILCGSAPSDRLKRIMRKSKMPSLNAENEIDSDNSVPSSKAAADRAFSAQQSVDRAEQLLRNLEMRIVTES